MSKLQVLLLLLESIIQIFYFLVLVLAPVQAQVRPLGTIQWEEICQGKYFGNLVEEAQNFHQILVRE